MPEGDTVHRTAATLHTALAGRALTRIELPRIAPPIPDPGTTVTCVHAQGKHLLLGLSDGHTLHTHHGMTGSWHLYRRGERWHRSAAALRALLGVDEFTAVCFSSPTVELLTEDVCRTHPVLRELGPDLCATPADLHTAVLRMARTDEARPVGEVLLDQRIACGIGNVYRSEALFIEALDPATPLRRLGESDRQRLLRTAARLLRHNLTTPVRTTVRGARPGALWVYARAGQPCRRCGTLIAQALLGEPARVVFWCPNCQPTA